MTRLEDRQTLLHKIEAACAGGARLVSACALAGIDLRTVQRWRAGDGLARGDRRPDADRPTPSHALTEPSGPASSRWPTQPRFAETPPARIVPALADEGSYIASESSFHRVLRARPDEPPWPSPATPDHHARPARTSRPARARSGAGT